MSGYENALAIIGMSGRFPGARNVAEFWQNLIAGKRSIRDFTDEELLAAGLPPAWLSEANLVKAGTVLDDVEYFDARFFGYTPLEAQIMDPQHRVFLECSWHALEDAGYSPETLRGRIGVFAGSASHSYKSNNLYTNPDVMALASSLQLSTANDMDALASTVAYKLNLRGPSVSVQTFCSTSLVAVHLGCQSLLTYESDMALAGGVAISVPQGRGYLYEEGGILSPDGHCRTFDARGQGSVMGSGVGVVVLKRAEEAEAEGDHIYALIRGSAVNNDGRVRVGYTAPGMEGQAEVIAEALANAGVEAETIGYVEAHGTATALGDAVELAAMKKAYGGRSEGRCAIGSVKPNVGHLDRASGVTGLIKTALMLEKGEMPPQVDFDAANGEVELEESAFYVNRERRDWKRGNGARRAGVSSFGLGGTNAHVVLEEGPEVSAGEEQNEPEWELLVLSAKTEGALGEARKRLIEHLRGQGRGARIGDVAYTLQVGRSEFSYRQVWVARSVEEAAEKLEKGGEVWGSGEQVQRGRGVVLELTGEEEGGNGELAGGHVVVRQLEEWGIRIENVAGKGTGARVGAVRWRMSGELGKRQLLETAGRLWLEGVEVKWPALHTLPRQRLSLPGYPFERTRYWVDERPGGWVFQSCEGTPSAPNMKKPDVTDWFYVPVWKQSTPPLVRSLPARLTALSPWLIFADDEGITAAMEDELRRCGADVYTVGIGASFERRDDRTWRIDPDSIEDHVRLIREIGSTPKTIVHAWSVVPELGNSQAFQSLIRLAQALESLTISENIAIWSLSRNTQNVTGAEDLDASGAMLQAALRGIPQEQLNLTCHSVDLDCWTGRRPAEFARLLLSECASPSEASAVAWRGSQRWVLSFDPVRLDRAGTTAFRRRGIYWITGGLGKVGLIVASHLARSYQARLVLMGRSALPDPCEWDTWLQDQSTSRTIREGISHLKALQAAGAEVLYLTANVADESRMREAIETTMQHFGALHGVIHAAGISDEAAFRTIRDLTPEILEWHLEPKAGGLAVLQKVLAPHPLDFCVVFSSLASVLGGLGLTAYAAANLAMDSLMQRYWHHGPRSWFSVNWDTWRTSEDQHRVLGATVARFEMTSKEGIEALETLLSFSGIAPQIVNSTGDLQARLTQWVRMKAVEGGAAMAAPGIRHPRPALSTTYVAPGNEMERKIAEVWQSLLGFEMVGIHDNFFELGGHSLIGTQLVSRLRQISRVNLPLTVLFEAPTVAELGIAIEMTLIEEIEALSAQQARVG